ncbi:MAG: glutathione S-transferase family protein [Gammaproteobacteria bacterium]|nr:glutathione S-transferase family protein [Gammaproteobacteria bacterium]
MITLYGSQQSRSFRALWALEEAKLDYEYNVVRIGRTTNNGTQHERYKALNFQGKVPTLVHNELVINESAAIVNYIAQLVPEIHLIPQNDIKQRAYYDQLCFFVLSDLEQPLWTAAKHHFVLPKEYRLKEIRKTAEWEFSKSVAALQHYISGKHFAVADHFTMADILISHTLRWASAYDFYLPEDLIAYMNQLFKRLGYQRALLKESTVTTL